MLQERQIVPRQRGVYRRFDIPEHADEVNLVEEGINAEQCANIFVVQAVAELLTAKARVERYAHQTERSRCVPEHRPLHGVAHQQADMLASLQAQPEHGASRVIYLLKKLAITHAAVFGNQGVVVGVVPGNVTQYCPKGTGQRGSRYSHGDSSDERCHAGTPGAFGQVVLDGEDLVGQGAKATVIGALVDGAFGTADGMSRSRGDLPCQFVDITVELYVR
ncbi:hypothetical protein D3C81_1626540 [compost metagenome]